MKNAENTMNEACEQGGNFKENVNKKNIYAQNHKEAVEMSDTHIKEIRLERI